MVFGLKFLNNCDLARRIVTSDKEISFLVEIRLGTKSWEGTSIRFENIQVFQQKYTLQKL